MAMSPKRTGRGASGSPASAAPPSTRARMRCATRRASPSPPPRSSTHAPAPPRWAWSASPPGTQASAKPCAPPRGAREQSIDEGHERRAAAPALDQGQRTAAGTGDAPGDRLEDRDVGAAELVDRLLGIADDEERRLGS